MVNIRQIIYVNFAPLLFFCNDPMLFPLIKTFWTYHHQNWFESLLMLSTEPQHEITPICWQRLWHLWIPDEVQLSPLLPSWTNCEATWKFFPQVPFPSHRAHITITASLLVGIGLEKFIYYFLYSLRDKIVSKANSECVRWSAFSQVTFHVSEQCKFPAYSVLPGASFMICIRNPTPHSPISSLWPASIMPVPLLLLCLAFLLGALSISG